MGTRNVIKIDIKVRVFDPKEEVWEYETIRGISKLGMDENSNLVLYRYVDEEFQDQEYMWKVIRKDYWFSYEVLNVDVQKIASVDIVEP